MSNVLNLPDQEHADEQAGLWISKISRGLTKAEESEFQAWMALDPKNYDTMLSLSLLWDDMDDLSRLADLFPEYDLAETPRSNFFQRAAAVAAVVVFFVISAFSITSFHVVSLEQSYETSLGEHSTVSLPDGSELVLNTNSLVRVAYDDNNRLLTLERGEINVDVAHEEGRPFSVKAGGKVVQAVGTAFNVELLENQHLELIVTDGKVRVGSRRSFEAILAGAAGAQLDKSSEKKLRLPTLLSEESLSISKGEKILLGTEEQVRTALAQKEIVDTLSWRQGKLVFNGEPLEEVIAEISRYSSTEFQFESEDIKQVRIAGTFKSGDIKGLLIALNDTFGVSSSKMDKGRFSLHR